MSLKNLGWTRCEVPIIVLAMVLALSLVVAHYLPDAHNLPEILESLAAR